MQQLLPIRLSLIFNCLLFASVSFAQGLQWTQDGNAYWLSDKDGIAQMDFASKQKTMVASVAQLTPAGANKPLQVKSFKTSEDGKKILIFTNGQRSLCRTVF